MASAKVQAQNGAQVSMTNQTSDVMTLDRSKDWSGNVATSLPQTIRPGESVTFAHLSDGDFGSRAAVVYTGTNAAGVPCGWVLAWDAPAYTQQSPNKVYVVCGVKPFIDHLDFNQIRLSLSASTSESNATDPATKTSTTATINESIPNKATVEAIFSLIP
ncbi:jasmonate-induced protein homolog [Silene latifolia]|uniref:jasmonate-induced protein homolog n=1 Tax=Silene latifolia TaxID=37657 RepID=UPI003D772303